MLTKNDIRYIIRKEFFGGIVWDSIHKDYYMISLGDFYKIENEGKLEKGDLSINNNYRLTPYNVRDGYPGFPLRVHLALSEKCNTKCNHCFFTQIYSLGRKGGEPISTPEIKSLIDEMNDHGCMELFIGGGEPFMRSDWFEVFTYANDKGIQLYIFTNGIAVNEEIISKLNSLGNIGYLSVSMEGADKKAYSLLRQGAFWNPLITNLQLLGEYANFPVYVRYTATSINIDQFNEIVNLVTEIGRGRIGIKVRPILPAGNAVKNKNLLIDYKEYLVFLLNIKNKINSTIDIDLSVHKDANPRNKFYRFSKKTIGISRFIPVYTGFGGSGGDTSVYLDPLGNIHDCVMTYGRFESRSVDNIRNNGLLYQWDNANPIISKRDLAGNSECYSCEYYIWCRGGCRARAVYSYQDINAKDPWCFKDLAEKCTKEELEQLLSGLNEG